MVSRERLVRYPALLAVSILENPNQNNIDCHSSDLCNRCHSIIIAIVISNETFSFKIVINCEMFLFFPLLWGGVRHGAYCSGHYLFTMINVRKQRAANTIPKLGFP